MSEESGQLITETEAGSGTDNFNQGDLTGQTSNQVPQDLSSHPQVSNVDESLTDSTAASGQEEILSTESSSLTQETSPGEDILRPQTPSNEALPLDAVPESPAEENTPQTSLEGLAQNLEQIGQQETSGLDSLIPSGSLTGGADEVAPTEGQMEGVTDGLPLTFDQQVIVVNGEQHTIVSTDAVDEATGEPLVILQSASGNQFALPLSTLTGATGQSDAETGDQSDQQTQEQIEQDLTGQALVQDVASTMIEGLATAAVNQQQQQLQQNDLTASSLIHQPTVNGGNDEQIISDQQSLSEQIVDSNGAAALASGGIVSDGAGNQFVVLTEGVSDASGQQINLTDVLAAQEAAASDSGNTFMLQTEDVGMKPTTQIITDGQGLTSHEEAIIQAVTASGNLTEGQIIHCVCDGVTIAYQIGSANNGELSLIQLGQVRETPVTKKGRGNRSYGDSIIGQRSVVQQVMTGSAKKKAISSSLSITQKAMTPRSPAIPNKAMGSDLSITRVTGKILPKELPYSTAENTSLLTGSMPGPSQLASSRRTYSRKNIVWVNPEQTADAADGASNSKTVLPVAIVSNNENMSVSVLSSKKSSPEKTPPASKPIEEVSRVKRKIEVVQTKKTVEEVKAKTPEKIKPVTKASVVTGKEKVDTNGTSEEIPEASQANAFEKRGGRRRTTDVKETALPPSVVPESPSKPTVTTKSPGTRGRRRKSDVEEEVQQIENEVDDKTKILESTPAASVVQTDTTADSTETSVVEPPLPASSPKSRRKTPEKVVVEVTASETAASETGIRRSSRAFKRKIEEDFVDPDVELASKRPLRRSSKTEAVAPPVNDTEMTEAVKTTDETSTEKVEETPKRVSLTEKRSSESETEDKSVEQPNTTSGRKRRTVTIKEPVEEKEEEKVTPVKKTPGKRVSLRESSSSPTSFSSPSSSSPKKLTPILKQTNFVPKGKRLAIPLICSFSPVDPVSQNKKLRESISSLTDGRSPDQRYDVESPECSVHVRHQSPSLRSTPLMSHEASYACQKCGYRTSRINNLIHHHKETCPAIKNAWMHIWQNEINQQRQTPKQ